MLAEFDVFAAVFGDVTRVRAGGVGVVADGPLLLIVTAFAESLQRDQQKWHVQVRRL